MDQLIQKSASPIATSSPLPSDMRSHVSPRGFLNPEEACAYLGINRQALSDSVLHGRVRALRATTGCLCFAVADLNELPREISAADAAKELTTSKDLPMTTAMMATPSAAASTPNQTIESEQFKHALDDLRRYLARGPKWVDIKDGESLFAVPSKTIKEWASQGYVRKAKLGPTFQSRTIYNADDLNDALNRIAAGKSPIIALRKDG